MIVFAPIPLRLSIPLPVIGDLKGEVTPQHHLIGASEVFSFPPKGALSPLKIACRTEAFSPNSVFLDLPAIRNRIRFIWPP